MMRTCERLFVLKAVFCDGLKIDATPTETSFGTTYYQCHIWVESDLLNDLSMEEKKEYFNVGIAAFLDKDGIFTSDNFDEAVFDIFSYYEDKGEI